MSKRFIVAAWDAAIHFILKALWITSLCVGGGFMWIALKFDASVLPFGLISMLYFLVFCKTWLMTEGIEKQLFIFIPEVLVSVPTRILFVVLPLGVFWVFVASYLNTLLYVSQILSSTIVVYSFFAAYFLLAFAFRRNEAHSQLGGEDDR